MIVHCINVQLIIIIIIVARTAESIMCTFEAMYVIQLGSDYCRKHCYSTVRG